MDKDEERIQADLQAALRESRRNWLWSDMMDSLEPEEEEIDWDYERLFDSEDDAGVYPTD